MMLGSVELSDHLVLDGLEPAADLVATSRRLIGGAAVVQTDGNQGGRVLRLVAENHLTLQQIQDVKALAALRQPVTMTHHRGSFVVLITGTPVDPATTYADPAAEDWYSGEITMIEVDV